MIQTRGRWFVKRFTAAYVCGLALGLFLSGTCSAQMSAFPAGERLAASEAESKTSQQLLLDLASARQMLANHPSAQANLSLGRALKALGETESASKAFDRALDLNPELAEAWFEKASIVSDQGDWSKAADLFRRAVAASPGYALAHLGLGEVLLRTGEFDNSASEFEAAWRIDGKSSAAHQGLGLIDLQEGKLDAAVKEFRDALSIRPSDLDASKGLARALAYQHKWDEAVVLLRQIVAANPKSSEATFSLGTALVHLGDKPSADVQFARARDLSSRELLLLRAEGDSNWGIALRNEGKLQAAAIAFRRASDDDPSYCEAHDNLGEVLWMQKDFAGALSEFNLAVRCSPESALARNNLGSALLYYNHDIESATEQFRASLASRPGFALAHFNLGRALAAKQDLSAAESEFRRAIAIDPDSAGPHVDLGLLLAMREGSVSAEARMELQKGLHLDPSFRGMIPQKYLAELR
jgi:protein O-GlcNAc transferase